MKIALLEYFVFEDNISLLLARKNVKDIFITIDELFTSQLLKAKLIFMFGYGMGRVHFLKGEDAIELISSLHVHETKNSNSSTKSHVTKQR